MPKEYKVITNPYQRWCVYWLIKIRRDLWRKYKIEVDTAIYRAIWETLNTERVQEILNIVGYRIAPKVSVLDEGTWWRFSYELANNFREKKFGGKRDTQYLPWAGTPQQFHQGAVQAIQKLSDASKETQIVCFTVLTIYSNRNPQDTTNAQNYFENYVRSQGLRTTDFQRALDWLRTQRIPESKDLEVNLVHDSLTIALQTYISEIESWTRQT